MNIAQLLVRAARVFPDNPAVFHGENLVCTYRGLADRAARVAGGLRGRCGLGAGDRVALFMTNAPEYLETLYAAWFAGLAVVPINAKLHAKEAEFIVRDSAAAALFVSSDLAGSLVPLLRDAPVPPAVIVPDGADYAGLCAGEPIDAPADRQPGDLAWLFYTSGTTGRPKGVMLSHRNLLAMTACYFTDVDAVQMHEGMVYAAPFSHGAGLYNFPHVVMAAAHIVPLSGGFDPAELVEIAAHHRRISLFAAPTMVKRLVDFVERTGADHSGFKTIVYGGGPMYAENIRQVLRVMGSRFVQIYGQGESPMTITALSRHHLGDRAHPRYAERIASVGVAQSLVEVRVADGDGNPLPAGATGEVLVCGETVMSGYWNDAEATAKAIHEGWLFTGDVGSFDEDGFLTLKDRSKDVIISGGSNIYPREVEEALLLHAGVDEVSVVGRIHADWGEEVVAFVVAKPEMTLQANELDALCLENIARFKRPKEYRFVAALPKNSYGKVLKTTLREELARKGGAS